MNSVQGYKGFITFLILFILLILAAFGIQNLSQTNKDIVNDDAKAVGELSPDVMGIQTSKLNLNETDSEGIIQTSQPTFNVGFNDFSDQDSVLGKSKDVTGDMMAGEFKEAILYNDPNYDFNKDGLVTNADWPLFIEFVTNPED